jgi:hypothetical protein
MKLFPMFHYDPRRWQVADGGKKAFPFDQVSGSGLYLGFKMYTAQGYRPWDVERLPILKEFYRRCSADHIPILNHCTPEGAYTSDREEYYKFTHPSDTPTKRSGGAEDYFNDNFVSPNAWKKVLDQEVNGRDLNDLWLCLAHFGGNTTKGREWSKDIIELVKNYDNVYADISSSFADEEFREYFKKEIYKDNSAEFREEIREKILFGTDWYMTLMDKVEYKEYCEKAKKFLDDIDSSLWIRFTQANPYNFYRLNEDKQIGRIARNIEAQRKDEDIIKALKKPIEQAEIDKIKKDAAYIMAANQPFVNHEESQK